MKQLFCNSAGEKRHFKLQFIKKKLIGNVGIV